MSESSGGAVSGAEIQLKEVVKQYPGQGKPAVESLSLTIPAGQVVMFIGPSGCGKTTSLKMINRLIEPSSGQILIGGEDARKRNENELRRTIGYVIQGGSLFPHMTVGDNIALVPGLLGWDKSKISKRIDELLDLVNLDPSRYRDRYPRELSGGQQQRVGVARGLAADPPVILMDEPFGAVDPITRQRLQDELMSIQRELHKTIVCVTHDIDEAIKLGDRILILQEGARIAQYDTPEAILAAPANSFVEDFVGAGSGLKQLSLTRVDDVGMSEQLSARIGENVAEVKSRGEAQGNRSVVILDDRKRPRDWVWLHNLEGDTVRDPGDEQRAIYAATAQGECNFGEIFTTDGRIKALHLTTLTDDKKFFPNYNVCPVIRDDTIKKYPQLADLFNPVAAKLTNDVLLDLNGKVAVDGDDPATVANNWLTQQGFVNGSGANTSS